MFPCTTWTSFWSRCLSSGYNVTWSSIEACAFVCRKCWVLFDLSVKMLRLCGSRRPLMLEVKFYVYMSFKGGREIVPMRDTEVYRLLALFFIRLRLHTRTNRRRLFMMHSKALIGLTHNAKNFNHFSLCVAIIEFWTKLSFKWKWQVSKLRNICSYPKYRAVATLEIPAIVKCPYQLSSLVLPN